MRLLVAVAVISLLSFTPVFADNSLSNTQALLPAAKSPLASKSLLLDISPIGAEKLVAVGQYGHILLSSDGDNWQQANVPLQTTLTSVFFLNESLGWAVGHDATILQSKDGGLNWSIQQYLPELQRPLLDIYFKDSEQGIAIGAYGQIFRTLDGGATWKSEFHEEFLLPDDIDFLNELKADDETAYLDEIAFILPHFNRLVKDGEDLYLLGEAGLLAKSIDFGISWQPFESFYQGSFFSSGVTGSGIVIVAGLRGHVFRRSQNDSQWNEVESNTTALLNDIVFSDDARLFILGNNGMLLTSNDEGMTFSQSVQEDGKSLTAGVWFKGKLIATSDVGIKTLALANE